MGTFPWEFRPRGEEGNLAVWIWTQRYYQAWVGKWDRIYSITYLLLSASFSISALKTIAQPGPEVSILEEKNLS